MRRSVLETLKSANFFIGSRSPYQLLASIYHVALPFEREIIEQQRNNERNYFADFVIKMNFDAGGYWFNIDDDLSKLKAKASDEAAVWIMVYELLAGLDKYLSGTTKLYRDVPAPSGNRFDRIYDTRLYQPTKINVAGEESFYVIIPSYAPIFAGWIKKKNRFRERRYYCTRLAEECLRYHRLLPESRLANFEIVFPANGENAKDHFSFLESFAANGSAPDTLSIALAPYDSGFEVEIASYEQEESGTVPFTFERLTSPPPEGLQNLLKKILEEAIRLEVDILIFPELAVDNQARKIISTLLANTEGRNNLKLVVAGSFHDKEGDGFVNLAPMFDGRGREVWSHRKIKPFKFRSSSGMKDFEPRKDYKEKIHTAHPLAFVDTPIGRMSTLICLDYLQTEVRDAVDKVGCHYLWVPLMTPAIDDFVSRAESEYGRKLHVLSACCASTLFKKDQSFLYIPSRKFGKGSRVRVLNKIKKWIGFIWRGRLAHGSPCAVKNEKSLLKIYLLKSDL